MLTLTAPPQPQQLLTVVLFKMKCIGKLVTSTRKGGALCGGMCLIVDNNAGVCN